MKFTLILCLTTAAFGQTGTIAGSVSDETGARLANATIQVQNTSTKAAFSAQSSADGAYSVGNLPPGAYELVAIVPGMIPTALPNLKVTAGQTLRTDVRLGDLNQNTLGEDRTFYANLFASKNVPAGPAPRAADGKPDLSGVWRPAMPSDPGLPEPLPWAAKIAKERQENNGKDIPTAHCLPGGMDIATLVSPYKIVQTAKLIVMLFDEGDYPRQIFLDGRPHPDDGNLTWVGHSIGHWEGDTLIVDTTLFNDKSWVSLAFFPHTEKLHVTERFRRLDAGHLEIQTTIEDPGAFAKPWTMKKISNLAPPDEEVEEYICTENERDRTHMVGK